MCDEILTFVVLMILLVVLFYQSSFTDNCNYLFGREWSGALKGVCCIVVILVHIPKEYTTRLQNMIGSFAFIAVTVFFLLSGYGLALNRKRKGYLEHFWRNRLVALLIPMFLVIFVKACINIVNRIDISIVDTLFGFDGFVLMILICYLVFYCVSSKNLIKSHYTSWICILIFGVSIITYLLENSIPFTVWPVPCLGFMYGVFLAENKDSVVKYLDKCRTLNLKTWILFGLTFLIGGGYIREKNIPFFGDYVLRSVLALLMVILMIKILSKFRPNNEAIHILGDISYEVYLSHGFVINFLKSVRWQIRPGVFILSAVTITVIVSYILHWFDAKLIRKMRVKI